MKYLLLCFLFVGSVKAGELELKTKQLKELSDQINKVQEYCASLNLDASMLEDCSIRLKEELKTEMRVRFLSFTKEIVEHVNQKHAEEQCKADALKEVDAINTAKPGTIVISGAEKCDEIKILIEANKPAPPVEPGPPVEPAPPVEPGPPVHP